MKTNYLTFVVIFACAAVSASAQAPQSGAETDQNTAPTYPPPPPPPAAAPTYAPQPVPAPAPQANEIQPVGQAQPVGQTGYFGLDNANSPNPTLAGAVTVPYALAWRAAGISAELGALWHGGNFIGGEVSYYGGDPERYNVYNGKGAYIGSFRSGLELTTVDLAYRYFTPIGHLAPNDPIVFYIGASGGVGFVNYSNNGTFFGFHTYDSGNWTGEGVAGFQAAIGPRASVRIGYRYVGVSNTWRFDRQVNLDSSVIEAGIGFRF